MSINLDETDRCDVCGREARRWNMLQVVPDDEDLPGFFACVFCIRSWNTLNLLTESVFRLQAEISWLSEGKHANMPSAAMYHTGATR